MALGFSPAQARSVLDALVTAYPYVQMHTADPGAAGTTAVAANTTRKNPTFAAAATTGASTTKASSADAVWTAVTGSEDYTNFSCWSAPTGGNFGGSGLVTANAVTAGDTFTIPSGSLVYTLPNAA